jgi:hypothetical protein
MGQMHGFVNDRLFPKLGVVSTPERWAQVDNPVRRLNTRASGIAYPDPGINSSVADSLARVSDLIACKKVPGHNQPADYFCHRRRLSLRLSEGASCPGRGIINAHAEAVFQPARRHVAKSRPAQWFATAGGFAGPYEFAYCIVEHPDGACDSRSQDSDCIGTRRTIDPPAR